MIIPKSLMLCSMYVVVICVVITLVNGNYDND